MGYRGEKGGRKRIRAVAGNVQGALDALRTAITQAPSDPAAAYDTLYPRVQGIRGPRKSRRPAIPELGPAFFTNVPYFAGGGALDHPCVILDSQVAAALRKYCRWPTLGDNYWSPETYQRYVDLLGRWAEEASGQLNRAPCRAMSSNASCSAADF
ncbi:hypothetical protein [Mycobacterium sp. E2733]|uniref:8-oxoguanine DNA glycosylase OGG fold protein n=1 Tax=Mycobacterium sp. E2733 TaxID=1834138 RepID=UPI0034CDA9CA